MTYQLCHTRFLVNTTSVTFPDGNTEIIGKTARRMRGTPKKAQWAGMPTQWAQSEVATMELDQPEGDEAESPDDSEDDEPEPEDQPDDEAEENHTNEAKEEPAVNKDDSQEEPVKDFATEVRRIWEEVKSSGDESQASDSDVCEYHVEQLKEGEDKRDCVVEKITGPKLIQFYLLKMGVRSGRAVRDWYKNNPDRIPVSGERRSYLGAKWYKESITKNGVGPIAEHVSFDEAHNLRNYGSVQHNVATLLPKKSQVLFTGTPVYNSLSNMRAYMFQMASLCMIDLHLELTGDDIDLNVLSRDYTHSNELVETGLVSINPGADQAFVQSLFEWADQDLSRRKWWCLLRKFRIKSASSKPMESLMACKVFASSFMSRRTASTQLLDHNGKVVYPTTGMLPCVIRTIYVDHCDEIAPQLVAITDLMMREVKKANSDRMSGEKSKKKWKTSNKVNPHGAWKLDRNTESTVRAILKMGEEGELMEASALGFNRVMVLLATDFLLYGLFFDPDINNRDPLQKYTQKEIEDVWNVLIKAKNTDNILLPENLGNDKTGSARLGTQEVARMASYDPHGGMNYRYLLLAGRGLIPTDSIPHMLSWSLNKSPMLLELINTLNTGFRNPEKYGNRVFIVTQSPLIQT